MKVPYDTTNLLFTDQNVTPFSVCFGILVNRLKLNISWNIVNFQSTNISRKRPAFYPFPSFDEPTEHPRTFWLGEHHVQASAVSYTLRFFDPMWLLIRTWLTSLHSSMGLSASGYEAAGTFVQSACVQITRGWISRSHNPKKGSRYYRWADYSPLVTRNVGIYSNRHPSRNVVHYLLRKLNRVRNEPIFVR
jgi:hypothetical protein